MYRYVCIVKRKCGYVRECMYVLQMVHESIYVHMYVRLRMYTQSYMHMILQLFVEPKWSYCWMACPGLGSHQRRDDQRNWAK